MHWRRIDPVQDVSGLLVAGADTRDAALADLSRRAALFSMLDVVLGADWLVLVPQSALGNRDAARDVVLPRLAGAIPLYLRLPDVWLPVGWEAGVPAHVEPAMLRAMRMREAIMAPIAAIPTPSTAQTTCRADIYVLEERRCVETLADAALVE